MMMRAGLLLLCCVCWLHSALVAAQSRKGLRKYIVQKGESCWSISLKLYGSGRKYNIIHKYNRLGPEPHILKPGQVLYIPGSAKRADASIEWLRKQVEARPPRTLDWLRARQKMSLWRLYKVKTGDSASVGIRFDDKSFMKMREQALLVIYGTSAQRVQTRRLVKRTILVERGTVKGGLDSLDPKSELTVQTPAGEIKLKSKLSQIEVDESKASSLSVYDGNATMKAQGKKVKVPRNYGTYAKKGKKPVDPVPLPAAPQWIGGQNEAVVFVPRGQFGRLTFRWTPVARAQQYRFELSNHADFGIILNDETYPPRQKKALPGEQEVAALVGKGVLGFRHLRLSPGVYYARVAARDNYKLEGYPSKTLRIRVLPMHTTRYLHRAPDGVFEAVGMIGVNPPASQQVDVSLNSGTFALFAAPIRLYKPGTHQLRFRPKTQGGMATSIKIRLLPVKAVINAPKKSIKPGSGKYPLQLSLQATFQTEPSDKSASKAPVQVTRGVTLPGLQLLAYPGGELPIKSGKPGQLTADFVAPATFAGDNVVLILRWAGGELTRTSIAVEKPPAARIVAPPPPKKVAPPGIFSWSTAAVSMEWANNGPAMPSRAARPTTSLQLSSFIQQKTEQKIALPFSVEPPPTPLFLRMSFLGELSLLDQRLGLDLELPWLQLNLQPSQAETDKPGKNKLGDIRLGGRFVAYRSANLLLSASLRVSLPTGFDAYTGRLNLNASPITPIRRTEPNIVIEPGLLLAWRATSWLTLHTNQLFVIDGSFANKSGLYYTSYYGAEVRPWRILSFGLEANLVVGGLLDPSASLQTPSSPLQGIGLSGAIRLHFDRARIGLVAGGQFVGHKDSDLNQFSIGLNFAFGFQGL